MKTLAIIGSGDLGQQIAHYAFTDKHYSRVVFFDDFATEKEVVGIAVVGRVSEIETAFNEKLFDEVLIGIGYKHLAVKKKIYNNLKGKIPFGKIIHSTSWVDASATIEKGCVVYPGCLIDAKVKIKANTILNIGCTIAHDTVVNSHCFLSPRVAIAGFVKVEELCVLGINTTIIDGISIVEKTQTGGGTVLIKSIEKSGLYVGNPAKFIR
ncbi:acetyltransferase [Flavobacterium ovatum]|uniref:acetyltransferase n=1 Tax=Flavobacterium ovatum TaxID=1928857 RepID=UPI00344FECA4